MTEAATTKLLDGYIDDGQTLITDLSEVLSAEKPELYALLLDTLSCEVTDQSFEFLPLEIRPQDEETALIWSKLVNTLSNAIQEKMTVKDTIIQLAVVHPLIGELDTALRKALLEGKTNDFVKLLSPQHRLAGAFTIRYLYRLRKAREKDVEV